MVSTSTMRIMRVALVLVALCVVGYLVSPFHPVEGLRIAYLWLFISIPLFAGSMLLLHRIGGWGVLLQVVGSAALLLLKLFDFVTSWIGHYAVDYGLGDPIVILDALHTPFVEIPMGVLAFLTLLFPAGFLIYAVRDHQ